MASQAARKDEVYVPAAPAPPRRPTAALPLDPLIAALARAVDRTGQAPPPRHRPGPAG